MDNSQAPWYAWPFVALMRLVGLIFELSGRFVAVLIGMVCVLIGVILTATVIGAVLGLPLIAFGLVLFVRGLF
jgi:hypothetical protein